MPFAGHAFERVSAAVLEIKPGSDHEIAQCQLKLSSYHRVPSSPGITHRPSAATRPISMPSYPVHDELSGSQVLMDVITLSGPHAEPGAGGSALAMGVLKPSVSIAAAATTSERVASNMIDTSCRWPRQAVMLPKFNSQESASADV